MQKCHLSACLRHLEVALAPGGGLDPEHAQQVIRLNSFQILIAVMRYARDECSVVLPHPALLVTLWFRSMISLIGPGTGAMSTKICRV